MNDDVDHREKLFSEYRDLANDLRNISLEIREISENLSRKQKIAYETERAADQLKRAIDLVIVDQLDPIMARFKVIEEYSNKDFAKSTLSGFYVTDTIDVNQAEERLTKSEKVKRMWNTCKEIWKHG